MVIIVTIDFVIESLAWIITICLLLLFIRKNKLREAQLVFLFVQVVTWLFGLLTVELKLISYPVHFFQYATRSSFTFEYFVYPSFCVLFNLNYPEEKSLIRQSFHYFAYASGITLFEILLKDYTYLIEYLKWNWYWTWVTLLVTFILSRLYYKWFFKNG